MKPLVSVVIPAYNADRFLRRSVASVLGQSVSDLECIVVDDGSTDGTASLAERLCGSDLRVRYVWKPNGGSASARNAGFMIARGEWIQFLDADDLMFPDKLRADLAAVADSDDCTDAVVYSDFEFAVERRGRVIESRNMVFEPTCEEELLDLVTGWRFTDDLPFNADNLLYHRTVLESRRFNEELDILEDHEFFIRMLTSGVRFVHSPGLGVSVRVHETNMTADDRRVASGYLALVRLLGECSPDLVRKCVGVEMLLDKALREGDRSLLDEIAETLDAGAVPIAFREGLRVARRARLLGIVLAGWRMWRTGRRLRRGIRRRLPIPAA
jgi:glycosyltransferase involved in cell wall biosynthesis